MTFNHENIRKAFPSLLTTNRGKPLVYLDSAASAQKPLSVINAMSDFYKNDYANIHRGIYELSERATDLYESARNTVAEFIHADSKNNIVFVRGATEGINLIATALSHSYFTKNDEIILSEMEHHANIVPWLLLKERIGLVIKVAKITDDGALDFDHFTSLFTDKTKLVSISHASNVLGTINPLKKIIDYSHQKNVPVLVDGSQAVPHLSLNVSELDCDFYVFSSHKLYGPTGIGVLYAKSDWLNNMPPYQGGGDMISTVTFDAATFKKAPEKFEAGTPPIAEAVGLAAAIHYLNTIKMENIYSHEAALIAYAEEKLATLENIKIIGTVKPKVGVFSMVHATIHPHDLATILDHEGIAVRAGHHCAMPLMNRYQVPAMLRISFGIYNNEADIDRFILALQNAERIFS